GGYANHERSVEIAGGTALRIPHAPARQAEPLAALASLRNLEPHRSARGRHVDGRAAHRLPDRDRHLDGEILAVPPHERVRAHLDTEVQVAGAAAATRTALATHPDAGAVGDARRHLHGAPRPLLDRAGAAAARARPHPLAPGAVALRARDGPAHGDRELRAAERVHEVDLDRMLEVLAPRRRGGLRGSRAAEHLVGEIGEAPLLVRLALAAAAAPPAALEPQGLFPLPEPAAVPP